MAVSGNLKENWLNRIDEHKGTVSENTLLVPYDIENVYEALLKLPERIAHGILFDQDHDSHSVLFGAKKSIWTGGLTFKGYATLEPNSDNGTFVYMYVKVQLSDRILQELFNELTDILEKNYSKSTSLSDSKTESSYGIDVYGSDDYDKKKNKYTSKQSKYSGVYYIIIGLVLLFAGSTGNFVLRFTNSSEALILFSLLPLGYGIYKLYNGFTQ